MEELTNMLQRIRVLAVQAANGTNSTKDRDALQQEVTELSHEITRIACRSTFAGEKILAGNDKRGTQAVAGSKPNGLIQADGTITLQVGSNSGDTLKLTGLSKGFTLTSMYSKAAPTGATLANYKKGFTTAQAGQGELTFKVNTPESAQSVLEYIDGFILQVDQQRAHLGAMQNRLESTIRNQASISENESDARSRIRDTDFAEETANLTQQQIIQQASQSILTQANQKPQIALALLGR